MREADSQGASEQSKQNQHGYAVVQQGPNRSDSRIRWPSNAPSSGHAVCAAQVGETIRGNWQNAILRNEANKSFLINGNTILVASTLRLNRSAG